MVQKNGVIFVLIIKHLLNYSQISMKTNFFTCSPNHFFCPNLSGLTNKRMVLFLKYGSYFLFFFFSFLFIYLFFTLLGGKQGRSCSRTTEGLAVIVVIIPGYKGNVVRRSWHVFPGAGTSGSPAVSLCHKGPCMRHCFTRKAQP